MKYYLVFYDTFEQNKDFGSFLSHLHSYDPEVMIYFTGADGNSPIASQSGNYKEEYGMMFQWDLDIPHIHSDYDYPPVLSLIHDIPFRVKIPFINGSFSPAEIPYLIKHKLLIAHPEILSIPGHFETGFYYMAPDACKLFDDSKSHFFIPNKLWTMKRYVRDRGSQYIGDSSIAEMWKAHFRFPNSPIYVGI